MGKVSFTDLQSVQGNVTIMRITGRKRTYNVIIDTDDVSLVKGYNWNVDLVHKQIVNEHNESIRQVILGRKASEGMQLTSENRDFLDNRRDNIVEKSFADVQYACNVHKNNKVGIKGVCKIGGNYVAHISVNGKKYTKAFSIKKYGEQKALELATIERKDMETRLLRW